jgi:ABC-2 type transport system permease protein
VKKAWIVARHEFAVTVKRVWFVFATLVPILMTAAAISAQVFAVRSVEETQQALRERKIGVVDLWGGLAPRDGAAFFKDESEATRALSTGEIGSYLVVPGDYLTNDHAVIDVKTMRRPTLLTADHLPIPAWIRDWLLESVLKGEDPGRIARAKHPFPHRPTYLDASGKPTGENADEAKIRSIAAYIFFFLLFTSIFTSSSYLLQGMAEEKEHRVMEMVISSVTPDQLMVGKLVGLGAAGLVQMAVWVGTGAIALGTGAIGMTLLGGRLPVASDAFVFCFVYYLLGYVLYGSLMLGFGALCTNLRESQQMSAVWSFLGASPILLILLLIEEPQGTLARIFSYVPFTAPTTMMFRTTLDPKGTPTLDIAGSIAVLAISTIVALRVSARLYRAGLLLYGKRPGLREICRWLVAAKE